MSLHGQAAQMDVEYVAKYVENMLAAIEKGSVLAQQHFPRTLELLAKLQGHKDAEKMCQRWVEGCRKVPSAAMIKWLPQIIAHYKCFPNAASSRHVEEVLMLLFDDFPQAVYMAVRVMKDEIPPLWERVSKNSDCKELERFCCALRHLQHPEHQLKNLKDLAGLPMTHSETWSEICADFGLEQRCYLAVFAYKMCAMANGCMCDARCEI